MTDELLFWKFKRLLKRVASVEGDGTSMISILLTPGDSISDMAANLRNEARTASNVKSKVNRDSILTAITSCQHILRTYNNRTPKNGLAIFVGEGVLDGKPNKYKFVFDDENLIKPITEKDYWCGKSFKIGNLEEMLVDDKPYGFVIVDGANTLFARVTGKIREICGKYGKPIPGKTRRGGQSANRIARIREEKVMEYVKNVVENMNRIYITGDHPNVEGIVIAGSAGKKHLVAEHATLDYRLKPIIKGIIDISEPMEVGLAQAIDEASGIISSAKYQKEKDIINKFLDELKRDTGLSSYGMKNVYDALEAGAVERLIVYENLSHWIHFYESDGKTEYRITEHSKYPDVEDFHYKESFELVEYLSEHYSDYGTELHLVSNDTAEGHQFVVGFGGMGAILRYKIELGDDFDEGEMDPEDFFM